MNDSTRTVSGLDEPRVRSALADLLTGLRAVYPDSLPEVLVYGSYARGEATVDSDLDLLLLFAEPVNSSIEISRLAALVADIHLEHQLLIAVLPVARAAFERESGPFWRNVRREAVALDAG